MVNWFVEASGMPNGLVGAGFHLTRFWSAWL